jgi:hypothetical protein
MVLPSLPPELADVTPEWVSAVLRDAGAVTKGHVTALRVAEERGGNTSRGGGLELSWTEDALPEPPRRLWVKLGRSPTAREVPREVAIYRDAAPLMPDAPLVKCYAAVFLPGTDRYGLLLENVAATHGTPLAGLPPTKTEAEQMIDALARFHAQWWDHPRLGTLAGRWPSPFQLRRWVGFSASHFAEWTEMLEDRISASRRELCRQLLDGHFASLQRRLHTGKQLTLLHGDAHGNNFLLPRASHGPVYLVDWSTPHWVPTVGCGVADLAHLMIPFWPADRRRQLETPLLQRYLATLAQWGVSGYDWQSLWDDYRRAAVAGLHFVIHQSQADEAENWYPLFERVVTALEELSCLDALQVV